MRGSARVAVFVIFALNGAVYGSWASRVPTLSVQVGAGPGGLGLSLLGTSVGLIVAAPLAARLCAILGARAVVAASSAVTSVFVPVLGLVGSPLLLGLALFVLGMAVGSMDVSMNVAAVAVVRDTGRPLMPVFHAGFSFGGLGGSAGAALAGAVGATLFGHLLVVGAVGVVITLVCSRAVPSERSAPEHRASGRAPIRRPVLWLLAAVALCSAVAEGACADWSALFLTTERHMAVAVAATGYAAFSVAMAFARLFGSKAEERWGSHGILVGGAALATLGLLAAVSIPFAPVAYVGFAAAGAGLAFCFPVALGLAGAAGRRADGAGGEREIGFVTTIAYTGFLAGPPMIGAIAQGSNLAVAMGVVAVVAAVIVLAARGAARARDRELSPTG